MKCVKCNAVLEKGSKFCSMCGTPVNILEQKNNIKADDEEIDKQSLDNNKTKKNGLSNASKLFLLNLTDKISSSKLPFIQHELAGLSDEEISLISVTNYKSVTMAGILEFFWWGLGRLYIGHYGWGITLAVIDTFAMIITFGTFGIGLILCIPFWIIFVVSVISAAKEENYKKTIEAITRVKSL